MKRPRMKVPVSVVIPVRNEPGNLPRCLDALAWADEIHVVDSHEHVIVTGGTSHLRSELDHCAFPSVEVFIEKHNRCSNWVARVALEGFLRGSGHEIQSGRVGLRRRLKKFSHRLPFRPLLRFFYVYASQRGFLDGNAGYHFARLRGTYEYLCVLKTEEPKRQAARAAPFEPDAAGVLPKQIGAGGGAGPPES